jgi:hypothetical protein
MNRLLRLAAALFLLGLAPAGWAAVACAITASPSPFTGVYSSAANLDVQGAFSLNCTRDPTTDGRRIDVWIGVNQPATGNSLPRDIGGGNLSYVIYRRAFGTGVWMNTGSQKSNQSGNGGLGETIDFGNGTGSTFSGSYDIFVRVPAGQTTVPAGIYVNTAVGVTVKLTDENGGLLTASTLGFRFSIPKDCRFSSDPTPVAVNYPAFSPTAIVGVSNFALTCTQGTTYTIALDRTRSVITTVQLAYDLSLSAPTGTGNAVSQPYTVNISVDAGQAGSCSGSTCNGTDTRTITITY